MIKLLQLFLTLSGLQAVPLAVPRSLLQKTSIYWRPDGFRQGTEYFDIWKPVPDGFRQGTEPSRRFLVDLHTGLIQEHISEMDRRVASIQPSVLNGHIERRQWLDEVSVDVSIEKNGGGWVRVQEPPTSHLPNGFRQSTELKMSISDGFRQGTEPIMPILDRFREGTEPMLSIPAGFSQGTEPFMPIADGFKQGTEPFMPIPDGFRQETEPILKIPDGFRQGSEPYMPIPDGYRQGTEPYMPIPGGFRQGTEPRLTIPDGFRQGTEPILKIPDGFKQGTEPFMPIPEHFRQGTESFQPIPEDFNQGTESFQPIPDGFRQGTKSHFTIPKGSRQGTEPSMSRPQKKTHACMGEVINGNCYEFNPTPLTFKNAQALCKALSQNAELVSVTSKDLHSNLVSLVTKGGESHAVLTWLGGIVKNQQASWVDGSEWGYSDWMPGHPNIHTDKPVCVEMFNIGESWWTANDCELRRASICSYPITA